MASKKYFTSESLATFIDEIKTYVNNAVSKKANSSHTHTIANVTNLQSTLDGKAASSHSHSAATTSTAGFMSKDDKAKLDKITADADSVSFNRNLTSGTKIGTITINGTGTDLYAPTNTDTHYTTGLKVGASSTATVNASATNGNVYLNILDNSTIRDSHKIVGTGATTVTSDANGVITINSTDNNTTYSAAGSSLGLVKSGGDVTISSGVITVNDDSHNHTISNVDNLQSSLDGKAALSHTHNYAGSSSAGGAATSANKLNTNAGDSNTPVYFSNGVPVACTSLDLNTSGSSASCTGNSATATKLKTARSIGLGDDLAGSANFDGSGNITISAKHYNASVNSGNKSNYPYHRFAYKGSKASPITGQYNDTDAIFCIRETYNGGGYGVLKVSLRTNASTSVSQASATWLARYNFALDDVKIGLYNVGGATYADLYIKVGTYARTTVIQLEGNRSWTLVASSEVNDTTTTDAKTSTECYVTIEAAATALHGQAYSSIISSVDGGQVNYANSAGSATTASTCSGNSATATKLSFAKTITLAGDVSGSTSFDGSGNVSITTTVADDSHNHTIANVDNLQTTLNGKASTSHNHDSAYISKDLQFTGDNGGVIISINKDDGKNVLTEIGNLPIGFYTVYSQSGTAGNPKTTEAWRFMVHKTGASTGWVQGYGSIGSVYTNYQDGATTGWRGWRCIWDYDPNPLWSGQMYMSSPNSTPQTVTPSKKLSECRTGWLLLWSDYDPGSGSNDADFVTTVIPKGTPSGGKWGGKSFLCDIPRYVGSDENDVDTERRIIKVIYVHDDCIKGSYQGDKDERNDVVLRAVYEI